MDKLTSRSLEPDEFAAYDRLVATNGSVFQTRTWIDSLNIDTDYLGCFDGGNRLVAAVPLFKRKVLGQKIIARPPFTPNSGPVLMSEARSTSKSIEFIRAVLNEVVEYIRSNRFRFIMLNFSPEITDCLPFRWAGYKVIPNYTYQIALSQSEEEIWKSFASVRRRNVRAALNDGVSIRKELNTAVVLQLVKKTFNRQSKEINYEQLEDFLRAFPNNDNSYSIVAYKNEVAVSVSFIVHDQRSAYYVLGGYDEDLGHYGAGALCLHEAIKEAKSRNLDLFDFEGSSIPHIEKFFRGFGGELVPYFSMNKALIPLEIALKFNYRDRF